MAIYHLRVGSVSRARGGNALAALAYQDGRQYWDERLGQRTRRYARQERVVAHGVILPEGAPAGYADPERLFNAVEAADRARNARPARRIEAALPREFTLSQDLDAIREFVQRELAARGFAAAWAIHDDAGHHNPHVHILVANRPIDRKTGRWRPKSHKEYARDDHGNKIPVIDPATGEQKLGPRNAKQWKRVTVESNALDRRETLREIRAAWADTLNARLAPERQVSERTLAEQGIDRAPTVHEGPAARSIEARGGTSPLVQTNRAIRADRQTAERERVDIARRLGQLAELEEIDTTLGQRADAFDRLREQAGRLDRAASIAAQERADAWDQCAPYNRAAYQASPARRPGLLRRLLEKARELLLPITRALDPREWLATRMADLLEARARVYEADPVWRVERDSVRILNERLEAVGEPALPLPAHPWQLSGNAPEPDLSVIDWPIPDELREPVTAHPQNTQKQPSEATESPDRHENTVNASGTQDGAKKPRTGAKTVKTKADLRALLQERAAEKIAERDRHETQRQETQDEPDWGWGLDPADPWNLGGGMSHGHHLGL